MTHPRQQSLQGTRLGFGPGMSHLRAPALVSQSRYLLPSCDHKQTHWIPSLWTITCESDKSGRGPSWPGVRAEVSHLWDSPALRVRLQTWGWSNSTTGRASDLHAAYLGLIPRIPYGPLSPPGKNPKHKARNKLCTLLGVDPQTQNKTWTKIQTNWDHTWSKLVQHTRQLPCMWLPWGFHQC